MPKKVCTDCGKLCVLTTWENGRCKKCAAGGNNWYCRQCGDKVCEAEGSANVYREHIGRQGETLRQLVDLKARQLVMNF